MKDKNGKVIHHCDKCSFESINLKELKRITDKYFCKECYKKNRKSHRNETIEQSGIKEELKQLDNKLKLESYRGSIEKRREYFKERYAEKVGRPVRSYIKGGKIRPSFPELNLPRIKGSKLDRPKKEESSAFITFHERQDLFKMLVRKGINAEEAKERIQGLVDFQKETRDSMKLKNKTEEEIKRKETELKDRMLAELWSN